MYHSTLHLFTLVICIYLFIFKFSLFNLSDFSSLTLNKFDYSNDLIGSLFKQGGGKYIRIFSILLQAPGRRYMSCWSSITSLCLFYTNETYFVSYSLSDRKKKSLRRWVSFQVYPSKLVALTHQLLNITH